MSKKEARPAEGVEFPKDAEGNRPTMSVNKAAFAAAMRAINPDEAKMLDDLPDKKWRRGYQKNLLEQVRQSAQSKENALKVANAGLDYLHNTMVFVRPAGADDSAVSLDEAMKKFTDKKFETMEVQGKMPKATDYTVQYKSYGTPGPLKELSGDALKLQIDKWVKDGAIETSCGAAMAKVVDNPEWCDLSDLYFVLFGASSAMGPFFKLMDLGANVIALDLDRPQIWEKLLKETRCRAGKLIFPVKSKPAGDSDEEIAKVAGCNLLTDTPEIRTWLQDLYPKERLVCMALAYLDGALFVKVSCAMDAVIKSLIEKRGADKMGVAYLCTPTDVHLCTPSSVEASKAAMKRAPGWQHMLAPLLNSAGMPMKKNVEKPLTDASGAPIEGLHVIDCVVPEQGPNYILAKRLQHWRAMVAREKGVLASSNVAPSTATASVLSNVLFALSYKGMSSIRPMEITYQETSNAVMASLLIRDVRDPTSAANPKIPLKNPLCLFTDNSWHGGCWRTAWKFQSLGGPSLLGYVFFAFIVTPYLMSYSLYQAAGWGSALKTVVTMGPSPQLWSEVGATVTYFQHLGVMEIVHASAGMVRSNAVMTFVQMFSRWMIVAFLNECVQCKTETFFVPMMLFAWCMAETVRYVYYAIGQLAEIATSARGVAVAMKLIKMKSVEKADDPVFKIPFPLVWLRYSMFIVLYPMGVCGEMNVIRLCMDCLLESAKAAQPGTTSAWLLGTIRMVTGERGYWTVLAIMYMAYVVGLPMLYSMLLASRRKQLGGGKEKKKASGEKKTQ
eukprot:TRINITY_DN120996_c0_g1_i1.p1 TRINITY_DN120996_c0_g1~~TRINITY_DN120996_c0_g1_i1.p1  ORF type:complete len:784 (+),score=224.56 TRINITY_DN120996_c0_g1_i1:94-2445(+)